MFLFFLECIYIYMYIYISLSLCCTISTGIPGPHSPHLPIVHCFRQFLMATSRIGTELLYVGFELDVLLLLLHMKGSTGVHHLWARPYFSSSVCLACLVRLILFSWWVVGGRITVSRTALHKVIYIYIYIYICMYIYMLYSHLHVHAASQRHNNKDRCMNKRRIEDFFTIIFTSHFIC